MYDTSYHHNDNSVSGEMIMLGNKKIEAVSPFFWKSGIIRKMCISPKAAETRSLMRLVDDSTSMARKVSQGFA